jgi:hypothetical protein
MKLTIVCTALVFAAGLGTPRTAEAQNWQRITTEDQYRASNVGREIVTPEGHRFSSHADGRVTGQWGGQPMVGAWQWHQGFWCRNVRVGNNPETGTDCQLVEMRGNDVRKTRDQGRGEPRVGTLR